MSEKIHVQVVVDTDEIREWAGKHAGAGHHGVAHVLYKAAADGESLSEQALREATAELQARLDAIATYAGHPGNWGTGDTRGRLIHDLATGAIDPASRDWGDTSLPETHGGGA